MPAVVGRSTEARSVSVTIPSATVTNKALTANVATLTTSAAHGFVAGERVTVAGVDATFNGTYTIVSTPSATTFTYSKTAADVVSVASGGSAISTGITGAAGIFHEEDVGRTITGTGIPAGTTIASVQSDTAARLSAAATTAGTVTAALGRGSPALYGFTGWSPESDAESETYTIGGGASANSPSRLTSPNQAHQQRSRA